MESAEQNRRQLEYEQEQERLRKAKEAFEKEKRIKEVTIV